MHHTLNANTRASSVFTPQQEDHAALLSLASTAEPAPNPRPSPSRSPGPSSPQQTKETFGPRHHHGSPYGWLPDARHGASAPNEPAASDLRRPCIRWFANAAPASRAHRPDVRRPQWPARRRKRGKEEEDCTGEYCHCPEGVTPPRLVTQHAHQADTPPPGLRHVPEEEDQVRREAASMHALHQLQDRMCLHTGREEAESAQRVSACPSSTRRSVPSSPATFPAKISIVPSILRVSRTALVAWRVSCVCQVRLLSAVAPNGFTATSGCSGCCRQATDMCSRALTIPGRSPW